jgi:hypothetical protein
VIDVLTGKPGQDAAVSGVELVTDETSLTVNYKIWKRNGAMTLDEGHLAEQHCTIMLGIMTYGQMTLGIMN